MADGGEAWKMRYLGSKDGTITSTKCRRARRSCWRSIAGRGGGGAVNLPCGCGGARWRACCAREEGRARESERACGRSGEEHSVVGRCRRARGSRRRPAAMRGGVDGAWPPRGGRALQLVGRGAARQRAGERGGRPGVALGWARLARHAALAREAHGCRPGRLPSWAGNEAVARE